MVPLLHRYFKDGCLSRNDVILSLLHPAFPFKRNAKRVISAFTEYQKRCTNRSLPAESISIQVYDGSNKHVLEMQRYLIRHLSHDLFGAYVHGSLGVGEEIPFSDFDALVILRDEIFVSPVRLFSTAYKLYRAQRIMRDYDPLQHHGWFVLTESQLKDYPEHYFPPALFPHSRSIFTHTGLDLTLSRAATRKGDLITLHLACSSIISRIEQNKIPSDAYELKFLLSQFMLLPALYIQDRDGHGIFKKHSFTRAAADFTKEAWQIMEDVSDIRTCWSYHIGLIQRRLVVRSSPALRRLTKRYWVPAIPPFISKRLSDNFYDRMAGLAREMLQKSNTRRLNTDIQDSERRHPPSETQRI